MVAASSVGVAVVVETASIGNAAGPLCFVAMIAVVFGVVSHATVRVAAVSVAICAVAVAVAQLLAPSNGSRASAFAFFEALLVIAPTAVSALVRVWRTLASRMEVTTVDPAVGRDVATPDVAAIEVGLLEGVASLRQVGVRTSADHFERAEHIERLEQIARATLASMRAHVHQLRAPATAEPEFTSISTFRDRVDVLLATTADTDAPIVRLGPRTLLPAHLVDLAMAAAALALALTLAMDLPGPQTLLAAIVVLPLAVARRALAAAAIVSCTAVMVFTVVHHPVEALGGPLTVPLQLALPLLAGAAARRTQGLVALTTCIATTVALPTLDGHAYAVVDVCGALGIELAAALVAAAVRRSLRQLEAATDAGWRRREAAQIATVRAVDDARRALARELHDAIAHSLTVVVLHASAARRVWTLDEARRDEHIAVVRTAVDHTLTALSELLGRLHGNEGHEPESPASAVSESPSVAEICRDAEAAGLFVTLHGLSSAASLRELGGHLGYRIVREALTNAMRHAPGSNVVIDVVRSDNTITIGVTNSPPNVCPGETLGAGTGLQGLREQLTVVGGFLAADVTPAGGFRVSATMPDLAPST